FCFEMAKMVDPLPGKSASIERACQSVSAERASRCASRGQRQLIIHILEMRMFDDNRFKCLQSCSCIWGQLCHVSDTPLRLEGSSDQVHRPFPDRCCSFRDGHCS